MTRAGRLGLLACCWVGAALRIRGLFANSFHADEALFAAWARQIAVWRDPLLAMQPVDKPPLLFYLQALFYPLLGPVEWPARLPSLIASLLLIPLTAQLARRLTGDRAAALVAAAIVAVAPLTVQFSATAFSDPLLTFWLTAALTCAAGRPASRAGRSGPLLAGLFFGLALATKYQAALFLPLLLGLGRLRGWRRGDWARGLIGGLIALGPVIVWLWARAAGEGVIARQWLNIGGIRPARSWELWPRMNQAAALWRVALGLPLIAAGLGAGLAWLLRRRGRSPLPEVWLVALFVAGYLLIHWLWAVPIWDRYLLPVMPLVAILIGRGVSAALSPGDRRPARRYALWGLVVALALAHLPIAAAARAGRYPIGGRPDADGGAAAAARLLEDAPYGTVLYDHWYSWQWRYHLFDGRVYVSWFPDAEALLGDLAVFAGSGPARYIALPASPAARPVARRLAQRGFLLEPLAGQDGRAAMTIYRIVPGAAE